MRLRPPADGRQGILPFVIVLGDRDDVTARAGLPLVVEAMRALGVDDSVRRELPAAKRQGSYSTEEKLESLVTLLAAGGDRVEDIRVLSEDKGLERLLGRALPSPDALLDFLGDFHDAACLDGRPPEKKAYVPPESEALRGLEAVNRALVAKSADRASTTATIDHDGTIIESHRQEALTAYEGTRGFQPLVAVWAEEELVVADEFRDGNVAGGEDPLSSVKRVFANLPAWVQTRYFRADSASYYAPLLKYLVAEGIGFSISADRSQPLRKVCQAVPDELWYRLEQRAREDVHLAEVEFAPGEWPKDAAPLRYVAVRFSPRQGELFEEQGPKYLAVVSNRRELDLATLVRWHWQKAGTVEHVHRVLKDELGAGVIPSARFGGQRGVVSHQHDRVQRADGAEAAGAARALPDRAPQATAVRVVHGAGAAGGSPESRAGARLAGGGADAGSDRGATAAAGAGGRVTLLRRSPVARRSAYVARRTRVPTIWWRCWCRASLAGTS
jgi:hypothetical protein